MNIIRKIEPFMWEYKNFIIVQTFKFNHPWAVFTNLGQFEGSFLSKKTAMAFIHLSYKEK